MLLLLLPIRLFEIGTPEWRPLGWIHTASVAALTLLYIWSAGGKPWLRHFAFPIAFFFVAVPWVTPIEVPIIQGLMRAVATVAAETVALFGIPTQLEGNLIRVTSGLVGVNEACSGVRSLQTALMIGLLFGELKRLSILRRVVLVLGAIVIAITANFFRAIFLVAIAATRGVSEVHRWHNLVGYAIIGLVFVGSVILAALLSTKTRTVSETICDRQSVIRNSTFIFRVPAQYIAAAVCWIAAVELGVHLWYRMHEGNLVATTRWDVQWPESKANFLELKIDEEVRRQLRFDQGHAVSWTLPATSLPDTSPSPISKTITCLLYLFRWNPGRNSALLANLHRPDVCLPASGWQQVADTGVRNYPVTDSFALPFRHFEFRHGAADEPSGQIAHVFYCLWEDRAPAAESNPSQMANSPSTWTRDERVRQVLGGRRHLGQQVMEFIALAHGPIDLGEVEARFAESLSGLVKIENSK